MTRHAFGILVIFLGCAAGSRAAAAFLEKDGQVIMEAERAEPHKGWVKESDADASGGHYMKSVAKRARKSALTFAVTFKKTGMYRVYIRCRSTSTHDNDCYVLLDGKSGMVQAGDEWKTVDGIKTNHRKWGWES